MTLLESDIDFDGAFPAQTRPLRLGVVGGGRISQTQAMAARLTGRWNIVAGAFSSDPAKACLRGKEWQVDEARSYADFNTMAKSEAMRDDGIEAVMITTPNNAHFPAAEAFIEQGIDIICDKPLTNSLSEAEKLEQLTKEKKVVFAVCYTMSCYPMVRQAREIVASGALGKINQIHVEFMQDWMTPDSVADAPHVKWRLDTTRSGPTS